MDQKLTELDEQKNMEFEELIKLESEELEKIVNEMNLSEVKNLMDVFDKGENNE